MALSNITFCSEASNTAPSTCSAIESSTTLLMPTQDNLPEGTFMATGLEAIEHLDEFLQQHPDILVKRLFLSDSSYEDVETNFGHVEVVNPPQVNLPPVYDAASIRQRRNNLFLDTPEEVYWTRYQNERRERERNRDIRDLQPVLDTLLTRAGPDVESLAVAFYYDSWRVQVDYIGDILSRLKDMPKLKELTVRRSSRSWHGDAEDDYDLDDLDWDDQLPTVNPGKPPFFPSTSTTLERLHLVHSFGGYTNSVPSLAMFHQTFPSLKSLRLTGANDFSGVPEEMRRRSPEPPMGVVDSLKLVMHNLGFADPPSPPAPPLSGMSVIVQPNYHPLSHKNFVGYEDGEFICGTPGIEFSDFVDYLQSWRAGQSKPLPIYVLPSFQEDYDHYKQSEVDLYPIYRAMADFEDAARGGEGAWKVDQ